MKSILWEGREEKKKQRRNQNQQNNSSNSKTHQPPQMKIRDSLPGENAGSESDLAVILKCNLQS